jgi:ABC-type antimicrobial peptide transport system permease subunit
MARTLWPDRDAVGQFITNFTDIKVIGVVADVRHGAIEEAASNEMYLPYNQTGDWSGMELVVRSTLPPEALVRDVRAALAAHDPALPTSEYYALESLVGQAVAPRRLTTQLLGFFSTLALTLAALGLYGVIAYSVAQRTQEIGIRMAIGAQRRDVVGLVLAGGLKLVALGVILGLLGSLALTRVLQSQLYGISAHDPLTYVTIALLLPAVATFACLIPARRATKLDPLTALRAE